MSENHVPTSGEIPEISVVMPCLNEARTLGACIDEAKTALTTLGAPWEIVVADNGSSDGSQEIAVARGARVVAKAGTEFGGRAFYGAK